MAPAGASAHLTEELILRRSGAVGPLLKPSVSADAEQGDDATPSVLQVRPPKGLAEQLTACAP